MSFAGPSRDEHASASTSSSGKGIADRRRRRDRGRLPDAEPDDASAVRAAQAANARRPEARHARRACATRRAWDHDASRRRRFPGGRHGGRRRGALRSLPLLRRAARAVREGKLTNRIRVNFLHMETDAATPQLAARLANVFPRLRRRPAEGRRHRRVHGGRVPIIAAPSEPWINGTRRVAEAGWRNENHSLTPADYKVIIDDWEQVARDVPQLARARWVVAHVPFITQRIRRQAQGARRRRQRARRLALRQRHGAAERAAVSDADGQRHPDRHELRRHADLADESVDRFVLRRDGQERARRAHQRGPNAHARRRAAPLYGRERLVLERGRSARHDRARQVRRPRGAQRRLLRRQGRPRRRAQEAALGAHARRRQGRARRRGPL